MSEQFFYLQTLWRTLLAVAEEKPALRKVNFAKLDQRAGRIPSNRGCACRLCACKIWWLNLCQYLSYPRYIAPEVRVSTYQLWCLGTPFEFSDVNLLYTASNFVQASRPSLNPWFGRDAGTEANDSSIGSLNCGQWSTLLAHASLFLIEARSKRPNLIQYPKFHWEFWQSLLLGGRRSIGRPLSMAACRGGRVSKCLC